MGYWVLFSFSLPKAPECVAKDPYGVFKNALKEIGFTEPFPYAQNGDLYDGVNHAMELEVESAADPEEAQEVARELIDVAINLVSEKCCHALEVDCVLTTSDRPAEHLTLWGATQ